MITKKSCSCSLKGKWLGVISRTTVEGQLNNYFIYPKYLTCRLVLVKNEGTGRHLVVSFLHSDIE